ncbi:MAG: VWA domain-containing protein [Phycisphaerales bacterium]|nr:MAG: VWA domain-containing protein [Phycisphaerales bacterium]
MKTTTVIMYVFVAATLMCTSALWAAEPETVPVETKPVKEISSGGDKPLVQMAIVLDTSGSMSGLIDQARTELWSIVNEFIFAQRNGRQPEVQVALYEYGKSALAREGGYIRQIVPLTTDLDKVSEELFALTTNGGDEYCGWVIREATQKLLWSDSPDDLKVIFIAGNEPFTQGQVDYKEACSKAIARGIVVNTIHCGPDKQGIDGKWKDGAVLADGRYLNIHHNRQVVHIEAPQDKEIAELGVRLNLTYIPYGHHGAVAQERQMAQDGNAMQASPQAVVQRAVTKSSANYVNTAWDLVDAVQAKQVDLESAKPEDLPENMRAMSAEERQAYVERQAGQRAEIQAQIQRLNEQRNKFVAQQLKKHRGEGQTLGAAIKEAIREQARKKNYTFQPPNSPTPGREGDTQQQPR